MMRERLRRFFSGKARILTLILILAVLLPVVGDGRRIDYQNISLGNETQMADAIRTAMLHRSYRVRISFTARTPAQEEVEAIVDRLVELALAESSDPCGGDYLRYQYGGYNLAHLMEKEGGRWRYDISIRPVYYTTLKQEQAVDLQVAEAIKEMDLPEQASDIEKIRRVSDFIERRTEYDDVHFRHPGSRHIQSTAYGALIGRTALCQGYAVLAYRLLKELGVDNRIVTGTALVSGEKVRHAWNIVRLNGRYYNLDITLDDVTGSRRYFLRSDAAFAADHSLDPDFSDRAFREDYPMAKEDYAFNRD